MQEPKITFRPAEGDEVIAGSKYIRTDHLWRYFLKHLEELIFQLVTG